MPQHRNLIASVAIVVLMLLVFSSVAAAHPGHRWLWPRAFDNVWKDDMGEAAQNAFEDTVGQRDWIIGRDGDDMLLAGEQRDLVRGGTGTDTIDGGDGPDLLIGGPENDTITGGPGRDIIRAGRGNDIVYAADGRFDWVRCGPGEDSYTADKRDRVARNCENDISPAGGDTPASVTTQ